MALCREAFLKIKVHHSLNWPARDFSWLLAPDLGCLSRAECFLDSLFPPCQDLRQQCVHCGIAHQSRAGNVAVTYNFLQRSQIAHAPIPYQEIPCNAAKQRLHPDRIVGGPRHFDDAGRPDWPARAGSARWG